MKKNDDFAFPGEFVDGPRTEHVYGMTLRDWFAGQALDGLLAGANEFEAEFNHEDPAIRFAWLAYRYADAMLFVREKEQA
jgi:hypothetical protein